MTRGYLAVQPGETGGDVKSNRGQSGHSNGKSKSTDLEKQVK